MRYSRLLLTTFLTFSVWSPSAFAADDFPTQTGIASSSFQHDWRGFYVGVQGGGFLGDAELEPANGGVLSEGFDGALGGLLNGYNFQQGRFVFGIDNDISFTSVTQDVGGQDLDVRTLGTLRGRVGYALGDFLPYTTAGLATGFLKVDSGGRGVGDESKFAFGYTVGAGLEMAVSDNIRARAQYNYVDLGSVDVTFDDGSRTSAELDDVHVFRAGVALRTSAIIDALFSR